MAKKKAKDHLGEEEISDRERVQEQTKDVAVLKEEADDELQKELKKFIIPKLRSASYRWKYRSDAIKAARVARGFYRCAMCKREDVKNKEFAVDHVVPVVALDGWDGNLDTYIRRMFVKAEGWQILCHSCHDMKTEAEVQIRKMHRDKKKAEKKSKE